MRTFNKLLLTALLGVFTITGAFARTADEQPEEREVTFRFVPGKDMFYIPYGGNGAELSRLYSLVDEYRAEITAGRMPVYVDGYCASLENREDNLRTAAVRSNRVKSELITHKGLIEGNFITKNHAAAYTAPDGTSHKDMVVVTLRVPVKAVHPTYELNEAEKQRARELEEEARREQEARERAEAERAREQEEKERAERERIEREQAEQQPPVITECEPPLPVKPYCFAVRTNLLYDAFLLPTLGVEWRVNRNVGIKLDGSLSHWGDEKGKVQKIWLVNPEIRWYLLDNKRFYLGAGANFGRYNIYKGMVGSLFSSDTGYQGKLWGAGLTVGYQLYLSRSFSVDFNLGLGYTNLEYDSFTISNETRVYKDRDKSKDFWGPTQAGISLVWTIGK
mgnify:CR=1 FL=1